MKISTPLTVLYKVLCCVTPASFSLTSHATLSFPPCVQSEGTSEHSTNGMNSFLPWRLWLGVMTPHKILPDWLLLVPSGLTSNVSPLRDFLWPFGGKELPLRHLSVPLPFVFISLFLLSEIISFKYWCIFPSCLVFYSHCLQTGRQAGASSMFFIYIALANMSVPGTWKVFNKQTRSWATVVVFEVIPTWLTEMAWNQISFAHKSEMSSYLIKSVLTQICEGSEKVQLLFMKWCGKHKPIHSLNK